MKYPCEVVKDLLPLYCDGVCSEESKRLVEEHMDECEACREEYQRLREPELSDPGEASPEKGQEKSLKQVRKKLMRRRVTAVALAVVLVTAACTGAGMWMTSATVDIPADGLIESVKYSEEMVNGTSYIVVDGGVTLETELHLEKDKAGNSDEELKADAFTSSIKITDKPRNVLTVTYSDSCWQAERYGTATFVYPVVINGKTEIARFLSIRQTVWESLTDPKEPPENSVAGPTKAEFLCGGEDIDWTAVEEGETPFPEYFTDAQWADIEKRDCMIDKLYYLPYSSFRKVRENSPEDNAKLIEESAALLWAKR